MLVSELSPISILAQLRAVIAHVWHYRLDLLHLGSDLLRSVGQLQHESMLLPLLCGSRLLACWPWAPVAPDSVGQLQHESVLLPLLSGSVSPGLWHVGLGPLTQPAPSEGAGPLPELRLT